MNQPSTYFQTLIQKEQNQTNQMQAFIETVFRIFLLANRKAEIQDDKRLKLICLAIFNYVRALAKDHDIDLRNISVDQTLQTSVDMLPFFRYIEENRIQLLDLTTATIHDVDVSKRSDLERYVLSQIYYLTQHQGQPPVSSH